ncbi:MAG: hypothetical protein QME82_09780 [Bacillota bacterium]|nr:hypothetical protein [Bacillota bacterium]
MSSWANHWDQAQHNKALANQLIACHPIAFRDWAIIVAFYSALHFVEAFLDFTEGRHCSREYRLKGYESLHEYRKDVVASQFPADIATSYEKLYRLSVMFRYLEFQGHQAPGTKAGWIGDPEVVRLVNTDLASIEKRVAAEIRPHAN